MALHIVMLPGNATTHSQTVTLRQQENGVMVLGNVRKRRNQVLASTLGFWTTLLLAANKQTTLIAIGKF